MRSETRQISPQSFSLSHSEAGFLWGLSIATPPVNKKYLTGSSGLSVDGVAVRVTRAQHQGASRARDPVSEGLSQWRSECGEEV